MWKRIRLVNGYWHFKKYFLWIISIHKYYSNIIYKLCIRNFYYKLRNIHIYFGITTGLPSSPLINSGKTDYISQWQFKLKKYILWIISIHKLYSKIIFKRCIRNFINKLRNIYILKIIHFGHPIFTPFNKLIPGKVAIKVKPTQLAII